MVSRVDVVLVIVGATFDFSQLVDDDDQVGLSLIESLDQRRQIILVVVDRAVPEPNDFPVSLANLSRVQTEAIRMETLASDIESLLDAIQLLAGGTPKPAAAPGAAGEWTATDSGLAGDRDHASVGRPESKDTSPRSGHEPHDTVMIGVSAPRRVQAERLFVARLAAYRQIDRDQAARQLSGAKGRAVAALDVATSRWRRGTVVRVTLEGRDIEVEEPTIDFIWDGGVKEAGFDVTVTRQVSEVILRFGVTANGVPVAAPRLEVAVVPSSRRRPRLQQREVSTARTAFASYAAKDRVRVIDAVIALKSIGLDVFQDCLDLHPGESWKPRLLQELSCRDLFVLFWSWAAKDSEWVAWELESVLNARGEEPVCVSPLDIHVPPPQRLAHLHFSDPGAWIRAALVR